MSGLVYQVQYRTNLTQGSWLNLGSPVVASGGTLSASDSSASGSARFYRVSVGP